MLSVIFEVQPKQERFDEYLSLAGELQPLLKRSTGSSTTSGSRACIGPDGYCPTRAWRDEKSVVRFPDPPLRFAPASHVGSAAVVER